MEINTTFTDINPLCDADRTRTVTFHDGPWPGKLSIDEDIPLQNRSRHGSTGGTATQDILRKYHNQSQSDLTLDKTNTETNNNQKSPPGSLSKIHSVLRAAIARVKGPSNDDGDEEASELDLEMISMEVHPRNRKILDYIPWRRESTRRSTDPEHVEKLVEEVEANFPLRANLLVQVYDFGHGRAERRLVKLGHIERVMSSKPDWVIVRWIHVPLGIGLYQSSIEDIFFNGWGQELGSVRRPSRCPPPGRLFHRAGRAAWPYPETEVIRIRSMKTMKQARDAALIIKKNPAVRKILDKKVFNWDHNEYLVKDIEWRAAQLGWEASFWRTAKCDLPWLLSDGAVIMKSPAATKQEVNLSLKEQTIQQHPAYKDAYITRDAFRCFTRGDGLLLSFAPSTGFDYVNRDLPHMTKNSYQSPNSYQAENEPENREDNDSQFEEEIYLKGVDHLFPSKDLSAIAHVFSIFEVDGVDKWHQQTPEWLMVYLMTELAPTPHSMRSGYSIPTILDAYDTIVSKLKERKFEAWKRKETVILVQSYLKAIDELTTLGQTYKQKLSFLRRLHEDCKEIEREVRKKDHEQQKKSKDMEQDPDVDHSMTMTGRVEFAILAVGDLHNQCDELTKDLRASLQSLFQLRSIEQNNRADNAEIQARAILIFTGVTVIFVPLSFLTSYFGMNVRGIADQPFPVSQVHFWKISGLVTLFIGTCVTLYLLRVRTFQHTGIWH